jgi:predicted DNA-binding transcriptional regulator AlpA
MKVEQLGKPGEVAEAIQKPEKTLAEWRSRGRGPRFIKLEGGEVRYDWADVRAWLAEQKSGNRATA